MPKPRTTAICLAAALVLCLFITACGGSDSGSSKLKISTRSGTVKGFDDGVAYAFLGIPYAAPPVGDLRWKPPVQEAAWEGVLECATFGNAPMQPVIPGFDLGEGVQMSEDCLYLNVWSPDTDKNAALPVMLWIPGGAYSYGAASQPMYNGANLATKDVVVVSVNYRLGPFGFLVSPLVYEEQGHAGNYGLMDMIAAMKWIQDNIENFGGDPDNVTIFGESAGGSAVSHLMSSPPAEGLFARVICQSGSSLGDYYATYGLTGSWEQGAQVALALQDILGLATLADMRAASAKDIMNAATANHMYTSPVMDGVYIVDSLENNLDHMHQVDLMIGTMENDGWGFDAPITSVADYEQHASHIFHDKTAEVLALYPAGTVDEARYQDMITSTTAGFTQPAREIAARALDQNLNVYRYLGSFIPGTPQGQLYGCYHSAELAYVFGNLDPEGGYGPWDEPLSQLFMAYWTNFARTGDPNGADVPDWPEYTDEDPIQVIEYEGCQVINGYEEQNCDFFETLLPDAQPDYPPVY